MESDIMLGVSYGYSVAQSLQRPVVICIALGSSQGGHDGHGALSSYLIRYPSSRGREYLYRPEMRGLQGGIISVRPVRRLFKMMLSCWPERETRNLH